jgi:uroporphyrinogen decarboxylase
VTTFGVGASHLAKEWHDLPVDVVGLDWRLSIKEARAMGLTKTLQGNLDPSLLLADWSVIEERAKEIIDKGIAHPSHIFNLGHGVFPEVNPDTLKRLTSFVHEYSRAQMKAHS